ncbi:MAG: DUF1800 domain-containing protein [Dehalococcoidia bacterium]|nr:DUF1800 domain-containing protein [Dehalococcoidia bacterium]
MSDKEIALVSHLMRRAGFGATRAEIEELSEKSYEDIVEDLLHPERTEDLEEDVLKRYNIELSYHDAYQLWSGRWIWRMINSRRPLEEKMALFWHHVFATAWYKSEHSPTIINQIETFREVGMSDLRTILIELSKDPAMNYWLDNCENHADQPNENWGRELLELFSMGVGNYSEDDIKNAARAFTGWTFKQPIPLYPYGHYESGFEYLPEDHDDSEKTFLGHTGNLNGEDIIDIIIQQEPTFRFLARHLYNFFVADEPQVPAWDIEPPNDPEAIDALVEAFKEGNGDIRTVLRTLFNSDFFKDAQFKKVKNPAELVAGTIKLVGTYDLLPAPGQSVGALSGATTVMGQSLMNPPTVEGWHTGHEWIDGGTLNERVNFAVNQFNDLSAPGVQDIISRLSEGGTLSPDQLVDRCLDLVGPLEVGADTRTALSAYADSVGDVDLGSDEARTENAGKVARMLQLIVASREYQFA